MMCLYMIEVLRIEDQLNTLNVLGLVMTFRANEENLQSRGSLFSLNIGSLRFDR